MKTTLLVILWGALAVSTISAQERPGLFFREDWKEIPAATPVTQEHVSNADLLVSRHGPGEAGIKKSHHARPADDPYYIWSGEAEGNWALSLRNPKSQIDLTGLAKVRWRSKQSGFRLLRIALKTAARRAKRRVFAIGLDRSVWKTGIGKMTGYARKRTVARESANHECAPLCQPIMPRYHWEPNKPSRLQSPWRYTLG